MVADCGSTDDTLGICKKYNLNIIRFNNTKSRSEIRNEISDDKNMYIEPWETIIYNSEDLKEDNYMCRVLKNGILTKEIRMWSKDFKFENPIYESIKTDKISFSKVLFISDRSNDYSLDEIQEWKRKNLLEADPYYYEAIKYLSQFKYKEFMNAAENYLFKEKNSTIAITMLKYYIAMVEFGILKNHYNAIKIILYCLSNNILMAEFWCLLGDIYFTSKEFKKAIHFYENAIILGNKRVEDDEWPLHINKYQEYPTEMINKSKLFINNKV